ncbi:hypothetical protein GGTG_00487 [Gaeumannomyces tritici R3-111a-1]|uniref:Uncharacterized protein n=1 Tax=Gaeumannomyces tritici (strain R3-111a-1) TaxID=644352 RepID=J3NGU9_GAET3|nr:hypothetical protein GGTG_00487 [Gaeumannomyces tritici R3-111a-1]EJT80489.1 hypothetical protein GGTG_00487 [Gaeumannomyces tritici R3-111a-1]
MANSSGVENCFSPPVAAFFLKGLTQAPRSPISHKLQVPRTNVSFNSGHYKAKNNKATDV